jgi:hypothetical protein
MSDVSQRGQHRLGVRASRALLGAAAFAGSAMLFVSSSSAAGASTPAKTVCENAIASHKTLTAKQIKACKVAKIKVPTKATATAAPAGRQVKGALVTLGAGSFAGGSDVAVGLYDVTTAAGQSGNFVVSGTDTYNEILGPDGIGDGVPTVRAQISNGDQIQISGLSNVTFTPVSTPLVTSHTTVNLYAGTWNVGQDIGAGRYVATPGAGQSGNFIVSGTDTYNEILGGGSSVGGVPSVSVSLSKGDVITISSLSQVVMTAK